jgi:hypothetical protein
MSVPWVVEELQTVDLGDERLDARFEILLSALGSRPNLSIPAACGGNPELKAAYRFFDNDKVTFDEVLRPHADQTLRRVAQQRVVLLVQDSSEADLTRPQRQVAGAGTLDGSRRGFLLHEMQAFTPGGVPLGTVWAEVLNRTGDAPQAPEAQKERDRKHAPIEEKESLRWLSGLRAARDVAQRLPDVSCVCVGDSEADVYELFCEPRGEHPLHWLVRACQDRALQENPDEAPLSPSGLHLRGQVLTAPVLYQVELLVRGREAKTGVETRGRRQSRQARRATVEVRAAGVTLRPPWRHDRQLPAVTVNVVLVSEVNPPAGEPAVEWLLVTTLPIDTPEQVRAVVQYYCVRWGIEVLFRTLKSGCRIEERRLEDVERVLPCLGLYLIVAWRTLFVCRMGQECPEMDCEAVFEASEWKAVWVAVHRQQPPVRAPRLGEMVRLIARLGGYVERKNSQPGPQTVWIGLQRLYDLAWAWEAFGPESKLNSQGATAGGGRPPAVTCG